MDFSWITLGVVAAITALIAWIGSLHELRTSDGKQLTRSGKWFLVLAVLGPLITLGLDIADRKKDDDAADKRQEQADATLANAQIAARNAANASEIARKATEAALGGASHAKEAAIQASNAATAIHDVVDELDRLRLPIEWMSLRPRFSVPIDDAPIRPYKLRLDEGMERVNKIRNTVIPGPNNTFYVFEDRDPNMSWGGEWIPPIGASAAYIYQKHDLYPSPKEEPLANALLRVSEIELAFYRNPISPEQFDVGDENSRRWKGLRKEPDLRIVERYEATSPWCLLLVYGPKQLYGVSLQHPWDPDRKKWEFYSNELTSVRDLAGAQMMITVGPLRVPNEMKDEYQRLRAAMELADLSLRINNRLVSMKAGSLKRHRSKEGHTFWEYRFAQSENDLFVPRATVKDSWSTKPSGWKG